MLFFLVSLYPLYETAECIRGWHKTKKEHFQHWLIFWFLYLLCESLRELFIILWVFHYFLVFYNSLCFVFLALCYFPTTTFQCRKYVILPLLRDTRKIIIYLKRYTQKISYLRHFNLRYFIVALLKDSTESLD